MVIKKSKPKGDIVKGKLQGIKDTREKKKIMFKKLVSDIFFLKTNKLIDYQNSLRIILKLKIN